jgi:heme-binding NEAT domain protein
MITMIAVGIRNPEAIVHPTVQTNLVTGFTAAANIAFSYGQHRRYPFDETVAHASQSATTRSSPSSQSSGIPTTSPKLSPSSKRST